MRFVAIWKFVVRPDKLEAFERAYGQAGPWTELFQRSEGFISTHLIRESESARTYLTIDTWISAATYARFRAEFASEYARLDASCAGMTEHEERIAEGTCSGNPTEA